MIAGSPNSICENSILAIKCSTGAKTYVNYTKDGKPVDKEQCSIQ